MATPEKMISAVFSKDVVRSRHEMVGMTHIIANDVPVVDAVGAARTPSLSQALARDRNTSSACIIDEATASQRGAFLPAISLIAMAGFMLAKLAAAAWAVMATSSFPAPSPSRSNPK
jgi:hypothetical protein